MINNISDYIDVCVAIINSHSGRDKVTNYSLYYNYYNNNRNIYLII